MAQIVTIDRARWPVMTVFELALAHAITHEIMHSAADASTKLAHWFLQPVAEKQVTDALGRMEVQGWIVAADQHFSDWRLTPDGVETVTTLTGGSIRMLDRGQGLIKTSILLSLINSPKEPS